MMGKTTNFLMKVIVGALSAGLLATATTVQAGVTVTYYHNDALGSPVAATDQNRQVIWRQQYRPYGEPTPSNAEAASDSIGYTGHVHDTQTGLTYMGARYYDPHVGRFMGVDPIGFSQANIHSFNRYAYANNNPYKYIDPDGRQSREGRTREGRTREGRGGGLFKSLEDRLRIMARVNAFDPNDPKYESERYPDEARFADFANIVCGSGACDEGRFFDKFNARLRILTRQHEPRSEYDLRQIERNRQARRIANIAVFLSINSANYFSRSPYSPPVLRPLFRGEEKLRPPGLGPGEFGAPRFDSTRDYVGAYKFP